MNFSIVVAMDSERGIGKEGTLPWRLPSELSYFHRVTKEVDDPSKQNAVVMGRKTWESIPEGRKPLPGRLNCVISRNSEYELPEDVLLFASLSECLEYLGTRDDIESAHVIGGAQLCVDALKMPECTVLYITEIDKSFGCDVFFHEFEDDFQEADASLVQEENGVSYVFKRYKRI